MPMQTLLGRFHVTPTILHGITPIRANRLSARATGFRRASRDAGSKNRPCDPFAPSRSSAPSRPSASFGISSTPGATSSRASSIESTPILARARPHRLLTVEGLIPMRADASLELNPSIRSRVASSSRSDSPQTLSKDMPQEADSPSSSRTSAAALAGSRT